MRVHRCFGFIDLCGFTHYTDHYGDEHAVLVLAELRAALRTAAARRGVRVVKWLGDGAMLSSTEACALVALVVEINAMRALSSDQLVIRAGIADGPVIMFEGDDYIGRPVNVASRLCDLAAPLEILATDTAAAEAPPWVAPHDYPSAALKGLHDLVGIRSLALVDDDTDAVTDPVCHLRFPRRAAHASSGDDDAAVWFCSEACLSSWQERL